MAGSYLKLATSKYAILSTGGTCGVFWRNYNEYELVRIIHTWQLSQSCNLLELVRVFGVGNLCPLT